MTQKQHGRQNHGCVGITRRDFLRFAPTASALAMSGISSAATDGLHTEKLEIEVAGYDYDRVQAVMDGRVEIEGCTSNFEVARISDMNTHVFDGPQTRAVTEIGLHPYMLAFANDEFRDYTLLPVFPLRLFRHKSIFIRTDKGIRKPEDLRGRRIATPGYSSTSLTWIRGMLQDEYGVTPKDVEWVISKKDSSSSMSGKASKQENVIPDGLSVSTGPEGMDESDLLETGEVDALFHAAEPRAFREGHPKVARLFPDSRTTERAYFSKTGVFPIMHAVAIKVSVLEANRWLAEAVFNAYSQAKQLNNQYLSNSAWFKDSLPWIGQEVQATYNLMGKNFWPYGIEPNEKALQTLFRYSYEQGLSSRTLTIEELFHPSGIHLREPRA